MANQIDERVKPFEVKMGKSIASLDSEFGTIRAGRANPHVLDRITVDYYGTPTPLQQVANISVPEARMIQIQPWEASLVKEIEKAIMMFDLGINPSDDGRVIRLVFPELTEDRRKELVKEVKKKAEGAKVARCNWFPAYVVRFGAGNRKLFRCDRSDTRPGRPTRAGRSPFPA